MSDDDLIVKISAPGADQAARSVENFADKLEELTYVMKNTGSGSKEFKTLKGEFDTVTKAAQQYAKVIDTINKTNNSAAIGQQKLNSEMNKAATQAAKLYTEQSKNALMQQKTATEMNKTAAAAVRLQMQQDRAAAAAEKMRLANEKANAPYNQMRTALKEYEAKLYDAIAAGKLNDTALAAMGTKYNRLKGELDGVNSKFKQVTNTMDETKMAGMAFASFLGNLAANFIQNVISSLGEMVNKISQAGVALDGITNTFAAGARGWKQGGEEMQFVADTANRLGLNLQSTYEPYAKFMTSFTRSGGTLQESRQIFEDLSEAMVALHLNSAQMQNIFVALEQMANKGTVQAEELKRQLGNALPGAFELAAQSMGITTAELMDMMKAGEVVSREFLPKFAALVKDSLGKQVGIAVNQYNAHLNRLQSQTFLLQANLGQLWNSAVTPLVQGGGQLLGVVNKGASAIKQSSAAVTTLQVAMVTAGAATLMFVKQFGIVNTSLALMKANALAASKALWGLVTNPVAATLIAIGAAALYCVNSINRVSREYEEMAVQQRDVTNNMTGLISEYSQLAEITNKSTAQQEAYNRVLTTLRDEYPTVLSYIEQNDINLKNLTQSQADNIASLAVQQKMQEAESLMMDELSNKWLIFGTRVKQNAAIVLLGLQGIGVGILHVVITFEQAITRIVSLAAKGFGEITEKAAWVASKLNQKELAVNLDNATKKLKGFADAAWDVGKGQRQYLNEGLKQTAYWIENMEFDRKEKAMSKYKDTVATLGQEQAKLAQQLMYSSTALSDVATGKEGKKKGSKSSKSSSTKEPDSEWDLLNKEIAKTEEAIKVRKLNGQSIDDLVPKYVRLKEQHDNIERAMRELTETEATGWDKIKKDATEATKIYQYRLSNSAAYTAAEIESARQTMRNLNAEVKYQEVLKKREDILQITNREASKLSDTLVDSLLDFDSELSVWDRFKETALSAIKSVATSWIKEIGNSVLAGWQAGWSKNGSGNKFVSALLGAGSGFAGTPLEGTKDNPTYTGAGALNGAFGGLQKTWQSVKQKFGWGQQGGSLTGAAAAITGDSETGSILSALTGQATSLSDALLNSTSPAISSTIEGFGGMATSAMSAGMGIANVANPAISAAGSIANMATAAPIAAAGLGAMASVMTMASSAFTSAAPALTTMATAMASLATSASGAATSMAALAVATAAESVAKIPYVGGFLAPLAATLTGAGIAAGTIMTGAGIAAGAAMAGGGQMIGGAMSGIGNKLSGVSSLNSSSNVIPHAKGGVVSSPTTFPMQGGNIGLAGEAGTEVIAPAKRMANGDIGIGAVQPQVTVNNYTNAAVEVKRRPDNSMEIKIAELNSMLASSRSNKGMVAAQSRMQKQGRQIG